MFIKFPKDDKNFQWTRHIKNKMIFYNLSESRIKSVLKNSKRKEEGIAPSTTAVMKRNDRGKKKEEIWVMYMASPSRKNAENYPTPSLGVNAEQRGKSQRESASSQRKSAAQPQLRMISAWRYPGVSKPGREIPIPEDILEELDIVAKDEIHE